MLALAIDCPERDGVSLETDLTAQVLQLKADRHPTPCRKCHISSWKELWVSVLQGCHSRVEQHFHSEALYFKMLKQGIYAIITLSTQKKI